MNIQRFPLLIFALSFLLTWLAAIMGASLSKGPKNFDEAARQDFGFVVAATLTLLGLIIGFTFSMATGRYDQRRNYEEEEANAIGTEYVRLDFLPAADAERSRELMKRYLEQRILFYQARNAHELQQINDLTAQLQRQMWAAVRIPASAQPNPLTGLVALGMNDVLNRQGYTQAAWWNRIPVSAWGLMIIIAVFCNLLIGYGAHQPLWSPILLVIFPVIVSISFFLIADIESPRGGIIRVRPQNLISLSQSLRSH